MTASGVGNVVWRKSSHSTAESNCVEVGLAPGVAAVRDTKERDGGNLAVSAATWAEFLRVQRRRHD